MKSFLFINEQNINKKHNEIYTIIENEKHYLTQFFLINFKFDKKL